MGAEHQELIKILPQNLENPSHVKLWIGARRRAHTVKNGYGYSPIKEIFAPKAPLNTLGPLNQAPTLRETLAVNKTSEV